MKLRIVDLTLFLLLLNCATLGISTAQIEVAPEPLESVMQKAYVVCVCVITASEPRMAPGAAQHQPLTYVADVIKVYRGPIGGSSRLTIASDNPAISLPTNIRYLLLLQQPSSGHAMPILKVLSLPDNFPPLTGSGGASSFEDDLDAALRHETKDIEILLRLLDQFRSLSSASQTNLRELASHAQSGPALISMSMLLSRHLGGSQLFSEFLAKLRTTPQSEWPQMSDLTSIFLALASVADEQSLEALAASNRADISLASLRALRKIADPATTGFLIGELASPNTDIQYLAMISLAEIHHKYGEFAPGMGPFELDRGRYIRLWREWYSASQR